MEKMLLIILCVAVCGVIEVRSLQCYECQDCSNVKEEYLQTCGAPDTTTVAPSTVTTLPNNTTGESINSTTPAPNNNTGVPDYTSTEAPTTSNNNIDTANSTTVATNTTTKAPETGTSANNTENINNSKEVAFINKEHVIKRRLAGDQGILKDGCLCENETCDCGIEQTSPQSKFTGLRAISYTCFQVTHKGNKSDVTDRGCVAFPDQGKVCDQFSNATDCRSCNTDKCNSACILQTSIVLLITTFCLSFK